MTSAQFPIINGNGEITTPGVLARLDERTERLIRKAIGDWDGEGGSQTGLSVYRGWDGYYVGNSTTVKLVAPEPLGFFALVDATHPDLADPMLDPSITEAVVPTHTVSYNPPDFVAVTTPIEGAPENPVFRRNNDTGEWESVPGRVLWDGTIVDQVLSQIGSLSIVPKDGKAGAPMYGYWFTQDMVSFALPEIPTYIREVYTSGESGSVSFQFSDGAYVRFGKAHEMYDEEQNATNSDTLRSMHAYASTGRIHRLYGNSEGQFEWRNITGGSNTNRWTVTVGDTGWIDSTVWSKAVDPSLPTGFKSRTRYSSHGMDHRVTYPGAITGLPKSFPIPPWVFTGGGAVSTGTDWTQDAAGVDVRLRPLDGTNNPMAVNLSTTVKIEATRARVQFSDPTGTTVSIGSMTAGAYAPFVENWPNNQFLSGLRTGPSVANET